MPGNPHECWSLSFFNADASCPTGLKLAALLEASARAARPVPKDRQRQLLDSGTLNVSSTIARIALGGDPNTVGVEQHNNWAYVGEKDDQIISVIDLINRALSGTFTIPARSAPCCSTSKANCCLSRSTKTTSSSVLKRVSVSCFPSRCPDAKQMTLTTLILTTRRNSWAAKVRRLTATTPAQRALRMVYSFTKDRSEHESNRARGRFFTVLKIIYDDPLDYPLDCGSAETSHRLCDR